jgi:hypothetical protein
MNLATGMTPSNNKDTSSSRDAWQRSLEIIDEMVKICLEIEKP